VFTEEQIPELLAQLTLEEKCSLLSGSDFWHTQPVERLGIPALMVSDGPHGLRKQAEGTDEMGLEESVPATCFPTAAALASTWDVALLTEIGRALAEEAKAQGVGVILGPGVNLKRSPLCGRNFEYFSEDPLLAGELAAALAAGIQSGGVGTSVKHFAANNQETDRMRTNARIDERTLREIYLSIFERIIERACPATLMCSYNRINDVYSSENRWLLTEVLREEWGFDGLVMTDWGAVHDRVAGVAAGLDLEMPSSRGWNDRLVAEAVRTGVLDESDLDRAVARVLRLVSRHHRETPEEHLDLGAHHELAREAASRSAVLLKNEGAALPLPGLGDVVVIGEMARTPRYQGAGSSQVNPTRLDNALDALRRRHPGLPFEPGYPAARLPCGGLPRRGTAQASAGGRREPHGPAVPRPARRGRVGGIRPATRLAARRTCGPAARSAPGGRRGDRPALGRRGRRDRLLAGRRGRDHGAVATRPGRG
jgi:beta-glucosidase-like glycosyl hydrolase